MPIHPAMTKSNVAFVLILTAFGIITAAGIILVTPRKLSPPPQGNTAQCYCTGACCRK